MSFLNTLNETTVTFILDASKYGWNASGSGFEAISWTGEVQFFATFESANAWRLAECRAR